MRSYIAIDLGAESGRVMRGTLDANRLSIAEIARFPNGMSRIRNLLHWDALRLFQEMKNALRTEAIANKQPDSIGIDTWGVDFALLASDGSLLGLPVAYRDCRTDGLMEEFFKLVPRAQVYEKTGIQFLQFNTIFQLFAMSRTGSPLLAAASDLLLMPDLFNYFFTGEKTCEFTNATTTQLLNAYSRDWDSDLLDAVGTPRGIMRPIVQPGTVIGAIAPEVQEETGLGPVPVVSPATHDTGSAVAAAPAQGSGWAYISSGTWSLMGVELAQPITSAQALEHNFTNEGGICGTYRFLKNIMGLWLVQRCRVALGGDVDYACLTAQAAAASPLRSLIDVDDLRFLNPPSMPEAIRAYCRETRQPEPDSPGALIRCALESLALQYRFTLDSLRVAQPHPIDRIHILGGGSRNRLLNQMAADATGLPVLAGPVEATAIGNIIAQAIALGHIDSLSAARAIIADSFDIDTFHPENTATWNTAYNRYLDLKVKK